MQRQTRAFLAIWHDIDPAMEPEWHRWHTYEHLPERVGIPGFLAGRRYMSDDAPLQRCFTLYEGAELSVFNSPAYLERLNNPTPWTQKISPAFRAFMRGACRLVATAGHEHGYAGAVLTIRLLPEGDTPGAEAQQAAAAALVERLAALDGVTGAHVGLCAQDVTRVETNERKMRSGTAEQPLDGVVVVEGFDKAALAAATDEIAAIVAGAGLGFRPDHRQVYHLAHMLREA